jgi:DeoR/GlpR family transcriptional regulator of sugar metabolism
MKEGLTEYNLEDAMVKWSLIASGRQVIVVADGSKFGRTAFASIGPLSVVNTIVTDNTAPADMLQALRDRGIQIVIANSQST